MTKTNKKHEIVKGIITGSILTLLVVFAVGSITTAAGNQQNNMGSMMHDSDSMAQMMTMMSSPQMQDHMKQCIKMMESMTEEEML